MSKSEIDGIMEQLGQISTINKKIKAASRAVIVVMHNFIFEEDGDRNNRRLLREFRGFEFNDDLPEFKDKLQHATRFTIGDLISKFATFLVLHIPEMPSN